MYFFFSHINNIYMKNQNEKEKKNGPTWGPNKEEMKFGFLSPLVIVEPRIGFHDRTRTCDHGAKTHCLTA